MQTFSFKSLVLLIVLNGAPTLAQNWSSRVSFNCGFGNHVNTMVINTTASYIGEDEDWYGSRDYSRNFYIVRAGLSGVPAVSCQQQAQTLNTRSLIQGTTQFAVCRRVRRQSVLSLLNITASGKVTVAANRFSVFDDPRASIALTAENGSIVRMVPPSEQSFSACLNAAAGITY